MIEKETLVLLALVLVAALLYVFFSKNIADASTHSADVSACRTSVDRNARLHISGIEFPTTLNCPAQQIKITDTKEANRQIAEAMYDCWYQYGEGKFNLFRDEAVYCGICTFIQVKTDEPVRGLPLYLITEQVPDGSGRLYYDYLGGFQTEKAKQVLGELATTKKPLLESAAQNELQSKKTFATVFVYAKGKDEIEKVVRHMTAKTGAGDVGLTVGLGFGAFAGGGAMITLIGAGVSTGPAGWIALGVGATVWGIAEAVSFFLSPDNVPEWASFIVLREWNEADTENILKNELGCTYFPSKLE